MITNTDCQHPTCNDDATETYQGDNGNTLKLCERHYYTLVAGTGPTVTPYDTSAGPITPFWDSGIRCGSSDIVSEADVSKLSDDVGVKL